MKKNSLFILFFLLATKVIFAVDLIGVSSPAYCSDINGNTVINIVAPTYSSVNVYCWKQGAGFGANAFVGTANLNSEGIGSIVFPADEYPHGPITLKISGTNNASYSDNCYLQLYNHGGVSWKEGIPVDAPPAATGMSLVFTDDFDSPNLSIGPGPNTTYYDHKPDHTDFSSPLLFTSYSNVDKNPFSQVDTYLRIRGDQNKLSTGLLSSVKNDGSGFSAELPSYFECRFVAPNAPGSWPAFWLLSVKDYPTNNACDEYDIIEAYGGEGQGKPNAGAAYQIAAHPWGRTNDLNNPETIEGKRVYRDNPIRMNNFGVPSSWYESPHIYGCKIEEDSVTYYLDNVVVQKHANFYYGKRQPMFFLINLATGGGWPTDLMRYNGTIDMYVDYVRVYSGANTDPDPASPSIDVSPSTLNFGEVNVGENKTLALTVSNESTSLPLNITSVVSNQSQFSCDWNGGTIAPGGTRTVNVTFIPTVAGMVNSTISINSNASQSVETISVSGTGKSPFVAGSIHYVKQGGAGIGDGSSWGNAAADLQHVISEASSGDTIFVAAGVYAPIAGSSFTIGDKTLAVFGAFAGNEISRIPPELPDTATNLTVLQGNGSRVIDASNSAGNLFLKGFRIQGGSVAAVGGGIRLKNGAVVYCTVMNNAAINSLGGGIHAQLGTASIRDCRILHNSAGEGGGLLAEGSNVVVDRCVIQANTSTGVGGGVKINSSAKMTNCLVVENQSTGKGGGVRASGSAMIYNTTIADNAAMEAGGGGGLSVQNTTTLKNSIVWNNTANGIINDIQNTNGTRTNSIYSGAPATDGNINANPLFVNITNGNYRLLSGSPAIDSGDNAVAYYTLDLEGNPRIFNSVIDLGAFEYNGVISNGLSSICSNVMNVFVYMAPGTDKMYFSETVAEVALLSLQGQYLLVRYNVSSLDLGSIQKGLYVVLLKDLDGYQRSVKIEIC